MSFSESTKPLGLGSKGKEPATLTSRIASSASDLARDFIASSSAAELTNSITSDQGMNGKAASASSAASKQHFLQDIPFRPAPLDHHGQAWSSSSSMRSSPTGEYRSREFEEFSAGDFLLHDMEESELNFRAHNSLLPEIPIGHPFDTASLSPETNVPDHDQAHNIERPLSSSYDFLSTSSRQTPEDASSWVLPATMDEQTGGACFGEALDSTMDWSEAIKSSSRFEDFNETEFHSLVTGSEHVDSQAVARLRMILGHIAEASSSDPLESWRGVSSQQLAKFAKWDCLQRQLTDFPAGIRSSFDSISANQLALFANWDCQQRRMDQSHLHAMPFESDDRQETGVSARQLSKFSVWDCQQGQADQTESSVWSDATYDQFCTTGLASRSALMYNNSLHSRDMGMQAKVDPDSGRSTQQRDWHIQQTGTDGVMNQDIPIPHFGCSWVCCHKRFDEAMEARSHSNADKEYPCPHEHCATRLVDQDEWATHINKPHHDLVESGSRTPISGGMFGRTFSA